ncbi:RNA polymerase sigma factor [Nonomuraea helvata]|uniref:RNA polymerase sigma factor n=1 Tax=Nonomuraea helvata TaxID=37484 RepID=A0ABV5RRW5_9ACTN
MTMSLDGAIADPERFATVFDAHYEEIRRYIGRRLDIDIAEDLAAETFLIAFRRRGSFDAAKGGIRAWLYGIATHLIGRHRRVELRRYRALAKSAPSAADGFHDLRSSLVAAGQAGTRRNAGVVGAGLRLTRTKGPC